MRVNGRKITISDGALIYRGRSYPLAGATATSDERRRGVPLLSRRTIATVTIRGDGWSISGRAGAQGYWLRRFVDKLNDAASAPAGTAGEGS